MRSDRWWRRTAGVLVVMSTLAGGLMAGSSEVMAAGVQPAQDEFVPMETVPPEDQLPSAPLLIAAYALLWIAVVAYLWSIWKRMATVERELSDLSRRTGAS